MEKWKIELNNEKAGTYSMISFLIVLFNILCLVYYGFRGEGKLRISPLVAAALLIIILIYSRYSKRKSEFGDRQIISSLVIENAWIFLSNYFLAVLNLILFIFEAITRRKLIVRVLEDRIIYPSFPKRTILWEEINNIIMKDGLLTIDMKNNKVYQNETVTEINQFEFNEFCIKRMSAVNK